MNPRLQDNYGATPREINYVIMFERSTHDTLASIATINPVSMEHYAESRKSSLLPAAK
jgi:hypothetical protein